MDHLHFSWRDLHGSHFAHARVLVTGGAGFIGSHLAEALAGLGASVVVLDDLSGGKRANLDRIDGVEFVHDSILNVEMLTACMHKCRYVFHQAALGSVPRSVENPRLYHEVNITGTLNVLEVARRARVGRVMFAASSSAYGENDLPWAETMLPRPRSPYAATKVAGEAMLRAYSAAYGLETVPLRYFNIFGPRQNANSAYAAVIAAFAKAVMAGEAPVIYGDGEQSRDFTFVHNAVHANLLAARSRAPIYGEVFNVGCGGRVSVTRLATLIAEALHRPDIRPAFQLERPGDVKHSLADLRRAQDGLGYKPVVDFTTGLRQTLRWYEAEFNCRGQRAA